MPELLDSELEAAMRSLLFWLVVPLFVMGVLCIVEPAYAFEIPFTDIKILEPTDLIINEASPVFVEDPIVVEKVYDTNIIETITRITGISPKGERNITVLFEGTVLAVLPGGSKFEYVPIHKSCLSEVSQYGTEAWYVCEVNRI